MNYKLAIFDLDGTLFDSFPWFLSIVNAVADKHRFRRIEPDQVEALRQGHARDHPISRRGVLENPGHRARHAAAEGRASR